MYAPQLIPISEFLGSAEYNLLLYESPDVIRALLQEKPFAKTGGSSIPPTSQCMAGCYWFFHSVKF